MSILVPISHYLDYYSLIVSFETGNNEFYKSFFFLKIVLALLGPLNLHIHFRTGSSKTNK